MGLRIPVRHPILAKIIILYNRSYRTVCAMVQNSPLTVTSFGALQLAFRLGCAVGGENEGKEKTSDME